MRIDNRYGPQKQDQSICIDEKRPHPMRVQYLCKVGAVRTQRILCKSRLPSAPIASREDDGERLAQNYSSDAQSGELPGWYQIRTILPSNEMPTGARTQHRSFRQWARCAAWKFLGSSSFHDRKMSISCAQIVPAL